MMTSRMSKEARKYVTATLITGMLLSGGAPLAHADNTDLTKTPTPINVNISGDNGFNGTKHRGLGYISITGEVGQKGNGGFISTGEGDAGGKSYGLSQFTSKGGGASANSFVSWLKKNYPEMGKNFNGVGKAGTTSFDTAWKKTYKENSKEFENAQVDYTFDTYVYPAIEEVKERTGVDFGRSRALLEMIYSTSVQFGEAGTGQVFSKANITPDMTDDEIVQKCTDEKQRSVGVYKFTGCSKDVQRSVYNRFGREEEELKDIMDGYVYLEGEGSEVSQQTLDEILDKKANDSMSLDDALNKELNNSLDNALDNALNNKVENNKVENNSSEQVGESLEDALNKSENNSLGQVGETLEDVLNSKQENLDEGTKDKTEFDQILDEYENNKGQMTESTDSDTSNKGETLDGVLDNYEENKDVVENNSDDKTEPTPTDEEDVKTDDVDSDEKVEEDTKDEPTSTDKEDVKTDDVDSDEKVEEDAKDEPTSTDKEDGKTDNVDSDEKVEEDTKDEPTSTDKEDVKTDDVDSDEKVEEDTKDEPTSTDKEDVKTDNVDSDEKVEEDTNEKIEVKEEISLEDVLNKAEGNKDVDSESSNSTEENNTSVDGSENTEDNNTNDVDDSDDKKEDSKSDEEESDKTQNNDELEKNPNEEVNKEVVTENSAIARLEKEMETNVFARLFETTKLIMENNKA